MVLNNITLDKLNLWSKQLDIEMETLTKECEEFKNKGSSEEDAVNKVYNKHKRVESRKKTQEILKMVVLAASTPREVTTRNGSAWVRNAVGWLDPKPFKIAIWGKEAKETIPTKVPVETIGRRVRETLDFTDVRLADEAWFKVIDDNEVNIKELLEAKFGCWTTTLENLEEKYAEEQKKGNNVLILSGSVYDKWRRPDKNGRIKVMIDNQSGFSDEDFATAVNIPEAIANTIEIDDKIIAIGDAWKPSQRWDSVARRPINEPDRVMLNAWEVFKLSSGRPTEEIIIR